MGDRVLAFPIRGMKEHSGSRPFALMRAFIAEHRSTTAPSWSCPLPGREPRPGIVAMQNSDPITSRRSASISGAKATAVAPTQPDSVEVSRSTPSRA